LGIVQIALVEHCKCCSGSNSSNFLGISTDRQGLLDLLGPRDKNRDLSIMDRNLAQGWGMVQEAQGVSTDLDTRVATGNVRSPNHQGRSLSHFNHIKSSPEPLLFTEVSLVEEEIQALQPKPRVLQMDGLQDVV
jgi:hypothetical protein